MSDANSQAVGSVYEKDQVIRIINSVISKVGQAGDASRDTIFKELNELQKIIESARAEIGATRPADINDKHIPTATDELDAVVQATAEATGTIMDVCDVIGEKATAVGGEHGDAISAEVIKIYEACSFQDITGQRITKVVNTLKDIEIKVDKLLGVLTKNIPNSDLTQGSGSADEDTRTGDEALLNGPQMADKAISQDDIDKLLAEFD